MFSTKLLPQPFDSNTQKLNWFVQIYNIARDGRNDRVKVTWLATTNVNLDIEVNGTKPISQLATESNHKAVEFLIGFGANPQYAVDAYALSGHFVTKQNAKFLLSQFSDPDIRKRIADAAKQIPGMNIDIDSIIAKIEIDIDVGRNTIIEQVDNRIKF